ncbi:hypothetical protein [Pseudomonas mosselii]|uniref:hypothetical protein n=1 Tax=Pseudomonas mosselii TaxID=78327 RepID=UPI003530B5D1
MCESATHQAHLHLKQKIEQFLSKGGEIQNVPSGVSGFNRSLPKAHWAKGQSVKS